MKRLTIMTTALALMLGMAQCRKNVEQISPVGHESDGEGVYVTLTAGFGGNRTEIEEYGWNAKVTWTAGDRLYVVAETQGYLGALTAATGGYTATFSGRITPLGSAQDLHFYYVGKTATISPAQQTSGTYTYSIASQDGTFDGIEETMHLMHGVIEDVAAGATSLGSMTMENMMAIGKFAISGYGTTAKCNAISTASVNLKTGELTPGPAGAITLNGASNSYYMALIPSSSAQTLTFMSSTGADPVALNRKIDAGRFYTQGGEAIYVVQYLPGDFTVAEGRTVKFSHGNLWWDGAAFHMEANQWYTNPTAVGQSGSTGTWSPSHVSHFYWSESESVAYAQEYDDESATISDVFFTNNQESGHSDEPNPDFTVEGQTGTWRTLSKAEWDYVLNTSGSSGRTDANRFAKAMVHNVKGLVVFPDGYNGNVEITPPDGMAAINTKGAAFPETSVDNDKWSAMESAGAVFLPAAGNRNGTGVGNVGSDGNYWSSTPGSSNAANAWYMIITSGSVFTNGNRRYYGRCVRLVRYVPAE